ncbi:cytochrome P450 3A24-like [Amblyomma americanum]
MLNVLLPTVILLVLYLWRRRKFSLFKRLGIPGPEPSLIWGNIMEIKAKGSATAFSDWTKEYGDIVGFFNGAMPFLLVKDVELLKKVLVEEHHVFPDRGALFGVLPAPVHPNSMVFTATRERWKGLRRTISPAFTASKLSKIFPVFEASCETLADIVGRDAGEGRSKDIKNLFQRYSLEVMLKASFGMDLDVQNTAPGSIFDRLTSSGVRLLQCLGLQGITLVANCLPELHALLQWLVSVASYFTDAFIHIIEAVVRPIVERRRNSSSGKHSDLMQLLLNKEIGFQGEGKPAKGLLSRTEVLYNACVYVFAGLDGTTHTVAAVLYLLAMHQGAQERLRKEITTSLDEEGKLNYLTIGQLKYLDMVLKESMRVYYQNVGFVTRRAVRDFEYKAIKIPKGVSVMAAASCLNQDPNIWCNPTSFDPERFNDENKRHIHPTSFLPFGHGPRACVGRAFAMLNIKMALATLLSKFRVHVDQERHPDLIKLRSGFLTASLPNSMWMKFEHV